MKLNNKGLTTIEIILSFVLVSIIAMSLYTIVSSYNQKKNIEEYKLKITNYKNLLTREIQRDLIDIGLNSVSINQDVVASKMIYTVDMELLDNSNKRLVVEKQIGKSKLHPGGSASVSDDFKIFYGEATDLIEYELPNLGEYEEEGRTIKNLSINDVIIDTNNDNILSIYIGFYHPELGNRYAIDIVSPIAYYF